jgi:hypothetical protein
MEWIVRGAAQVSAVLFVVLAVGLVVATLLVRSGKLEKRTERALRGFVDYVGNP